ncbi:MULTISPECIES: TetR/AcrR family transcriptional regulator [Streptomyces]|uniref:TetR-family transcriptional regulator n=1 Tax=Streptomyces griseus subsp. griseus (strain JCM 4626 / CBS 651.72 / NBRC 13350 / KCC S-0626 / ISP 5235) TaxID=455632 RepID=B1VPI9_STRGG|nr:MULTISPECIES: TetR/AcrR family transcriptional regulator [Streptomyces]MYR54558.1 TetR family transcriptional regulator [Streptomyces sp. SID4928]MYT82110.1 TetR family transcriptional regulator [Streptomyces sp. SID8364]EGE46556.1 regulatory protein TetR [Streptomyces sp. ACT-1]NEB52513.1 TetR/AcrR family transcriptional regulator [Streptomyces griseus]SBV07610.1 transcriptional regulator, TetR family [Streptomyces sp. MnatMP-M77]
MPRISAATVAEHHAQQRLALVRAARELLESGDAGAVTFAAIAKATGLARNSVYKYFPGRPELFAAVVEDAMPRWTDAIRAGMSAAGTPEEKIAAYVASQLDLVRGGEHRIAQALAGVRDTAVVRDSATRAHRELLTPLIGALTELGEEDPRRTSLLLQGIVNAATTAIENGDDPDAVTELAVRMAVTAVTGTPPGR